MADDKRGAQQAMVEVDNQTGGVRRTKSRMPAKTGILVAVVVAAGAAAAGAAAVNTFSAATGTYVHPGDRNAQAIGTGEALALGAPDDVSVGMKLTQDIQFAPGYESWKAGTIAFQTALGPGSPPAGQAFMTSSALRWQVAEAAVCSWLNYYVSSQAAGDTAATEGAAGQIEAASSWPAITGLNYPSGLGSAIAAVSAGDGKLVQALIDTARAGNCLAIGPLFSPEGLSPAAQQVKLASARQAGQQEIATDAVARRLGISS